MLLNDNHTMNPKLKIETILLYKMVIIMKEHNDARHNYNTYVSLKNIERVMFNQIKDLTKRSIHGKASN